MDVLLMCLERFTYSKVLRLSALPHPAHPGVVFICAVWF